MLNLSSSVDLHFRLIEQSGLWKKSCGVSTIFGAAITYRPWMLSSYDHCIPSVFGIGNKGHEYGDQTMNYRMILLTLLLIRRLKLKIQFLHKA